MAEVRRIVVVGVPMTHGIGMGLSIALLHEEAAVRSLNGLGEIVRRPISDR